MTYIRVFVVALIVVFAPLTEGFLDRLRRMSDAGCRRAANECMEYHLIRSLSDIQQALANRTLVSEMAVDLENAAICVEGVAADLRGPDQRKRRCQRRLRWSGPLKFLSDFISSPGTIDKIVAVSASPCLADKSVLQQASTVLQQCVETFGQAIEETLDGLCASFSQLWQCIEGSVVQVCGTEFGDLIGSLKQFALSSSRGPGYLAWLTAQSDMDFSSCQQQVILTRRAALPLKWNF